MRGSYELDTCPPPLSEAEKNRLKRGEMWWCVVDRRTIRFIVCWKTKPKHASTMKIPTQESRAEQARRLAAKTDKK